MMPWINEFGDLIEGENHGVMRDVEDLVPDGDEGERKITSIQVSNEQNLWLSHSLLRFAV